MLVLFVACGPSNQIDAALTGCPKWPAVLVAGGMYTVCCIFKLQQVHVASEMQAQTSVFNRLAAVIVSDVVAWKTGRVLLLSLTTRQFGVERTHQKQA